MGRFVLVSALAAALCACAGQKPVPASRPQAKSIAPAGEAVWHLRVGLNVAALMCKGRGRPSVAGDYGRLLARHRSLLASAHAAEQRRHGRGFETHQTRIYNRFANQRDPGSFCRRASQVAKRAATLDSLALAREAGGLLSQID